MVLALLAAVERKAQALEYVPVYSGSLLGGQYYIKGDRGSLAANASLIAAPILKAESGWSMIPLYSGNYQGTKDVADGVGAGTLFQQQMDHRLSFTGIIVPSESSWKLKPSVSYKREFLKETRDEAWGHGLFDYEKIGLGFEAENVYRDPFSYRVALDVYRIRFPNFESLESNSGFDPQGNPLGRELSSRNVLDTYNYQFSVNLSRPIPYEEPTVSLRLSYSFLYKVFSDQRIVNSQGQFNAAGRQDANHSVSIAAIHPRPVYIAGHEYRLATSLGALAVYNDSNQNSFDATFVQYIPNAYSYFNFGGGPSLSLAWGESKQPSSLSVSFRYNRTAYESRPARESSGLYASSDQYQDYYSSSLVYSYPIASGINLKAQANFLWAASNNAYEKTYSYTYRTANYLMGFTYEY